ncbi:hypothetical protein HNQ57_001122 [Zhongshania antarctica]|uniref:DUF3108 domain-containing protein n=1 Tax=Zhongshania antarctica TaxID=641702 RepID=A0A840R170_9GAMM|nr:DUF3108 domain-containing protein [Zhongshania antarctica]MBB5186859.1 hypothetical protein [Zhongshania antarctica]
MSKSYPKMAFFFSKNNLLVLLFCSLASQVFASGGGMSAIPNTGPKMLVPVPPTKTSPINAEPTKVESVKTPAAQTSKILPYEAEYKISSNSLTTTATRSLSKQGNNWQLSQRAKLMFIKVSEESIIEDGAMGLRPLRYEYSNSFSSKHDQKINFDWPRALASDKKYRKPWSAPLTAGTFDQLSAQLQMRQALISGRFDTTMVQTVVNRGKHKTYRVEKMGEEVIDSPVGKLNTVKLRRSREDSDSETIVWLAKDWNYLIVRLEQTDEDDTYSLELLSATLNAKKVKG